MKSIISLKRFSKPKAVWLALVAAVLALASPVYAAAPSITGINANITVDDTQATNVFGNVNVNDTTTNILTVFISYAPTNLGSLGVISGVTVSNLTNYVIGPATLTSVSNTLTSLVFTPRSDFIPVPNTSNVTFRIYAKDAADVFSGTNSSTVHITATNDPAVISASGATSFNINDSASIKPFIRVSVADEDDSGAQLQTITVNMTDNTLGYLEVGSTGVASNNFIYTYTGTPAAVTTALSNLVYFPTPNLLPVDSTDTNGFRIRTTDGYSFATNSAIQVIATSINDSPSISGLPAAHLPVQTGSSVLPFSLISVSDPDVNDNTNILTGQSLSLTVRLTGTNVIGNFQSGGNNYGTNYAVTGVDPVTAGNLLRALTYRPPSSPVAGTNTMTLTISLSDGHGGSVTSNFFADVFSVAEAPTLSGTQSGLRVNDNTTVKPFGSVTLQSYNGSPVTVTVALAGAGVTNEVQGQIVNLSGFTKNNATAPPTYTFAGSSDLATTAIRSLLFQPTANRIKGNTNESVQFSIILGDSVYTNAPDLSTTVIVTPVNDNPTIVGVSPLVTIQDNQTINPFPTMLISDVDEGGQQSLRVTVTFNTNNGYFDYASLTNYGFSSNSGSYSITGTNVNAAIRGLKFVPTPGQVAVGLTVTTTFTVEVNDQQGGDIFNNGTLVRVAAVSGSPIISWGVPQPFSIPLAVSNYPFAPVTIADPNSLNLSVTIDNASLGSFTPASVTAAGFVSKGGGVYTFSGTASNATAGIALLNFAPGGGLTLGSVVNFTIAATNPIPNVTVTNFSVVFRQIPRSFIVTTNSDYDPNTSPPASVTGGTLRKAIQDAGANDHITFDIRSGSASIADYPTTIRLKSPLTLNNNLVFDGPGADAVTISGDTDGDGTQDVQLFVINSTVTMNRLSFANGHASFAGGAFEVSSNGSLTLSYCAVTNCVGDFWGGAVDVTGGQLNMDHCLISGNSTKSGLGQGGGGISFYTQQGGTIANCTFSGNQQLAVNGLGGGALYVEDSNPGVEMDVYILNCTFTGNTDAAGHGSSIRPNVFNTTVPVQNSIFADGQGKNLEMDQSGAIISLGGNVSDDSTHTIFSAGGDPVDTVIFGETNDLVNTSANLLPLANNGGPTWTIALATNSPAIGNAVTNSPSSGVLGVDQRGFLRLDGHSDSGALERSATNRIIIEEVLFNPAPPNTNDDFIEFFVPRDSGSVNFAGYQIYAGGTLRHTITNVLLQPGQALVVFSSNAVNHAVPSGVYSQIATANLKLDNAADVITVQNPAGQVIYKADYVGSFTSSSLTDPGYLTVSNQSLVLSPQFKGNFLPYQRVVAKEGGTVPAGLSNAGYDASGKPLAIGNAPPRAFDDFISTDAQTVLSAVAALANDTDSDGGDTIRVVGVGLTNGVTPGVTGLTNLSSLGAAISINNSPGAGASITYDPTASSIIKALPQGTVVVDTFQYTILDSDSSGDHNRGANLTETNANLVKATATITVTVTGVNLPPTPQADGTNTNAGLTTREDTVLDFTTVNTLIANDTDPNTDDSSNTLNIVSIETVPSYVSNSVQITTALGASVALDIRFDRNETHITYDPTGSSVLNALALGQSVVDTFYYTVRDSHNAVGTAAVNITVTGVNDGPTANPDSFVTDEDTIVTVPALTLLANDTDPDTGTVLQITAVSTNSTFGARVQIVGTNIIYDPTVSSNLNALARKEIVVDTFTYTATDDHGVSSNAVVTVTVTGVNDHPISAADVNTIDEDHLLSVGGLGVLANDRDPDVNGHAPDDVMIVTGYTNFITPGGATVTVHPDGSYTYDPRVVFDWLKQGDLTNDVFSYVVLDHSLTIANDDVYGVQANTTGNILKVLVNDTILSQMQGAVLSIASVGTPNHGGSVAIQGTNLVYSPAGLFSGTETFSYTISDGLGGTDTATVTVQVSANTLYANADAYTVSKGNTALLNVLENDVLAPASAASITVLSVGLPDHGGLVSVSGVGANNFISYTPNPSNNFPFTETFTYLASAGGSIQATGTVTVRAIDRTDTLTANDDTFVVMAGSGNNILDVLVNDLALPNANTNLTITSVQTNLVGFSGTIFINNAHNRLVYKPAAGVTNHPEPFINYTISDGFGGSATGSVAIVVSAGGFFAGPDVFTVTRNSHSNLLSVMVNDIELPNTGQVLFISDIGISNNIPNHGGTVAINGAGTGLIYTPASNYFGDEFFTYEISDGTTARATNQVHVKVVDLAAVNSNTNYYHVTRDSTNNPMAVLKNDYVLPKVSLPLTITGIETNGLIGTVTISSVSVDNILSYSPPPGFIGTDTFKYDIVDSNGNPGVNTVIVTVGTLVTHSDLFSVLSDTSSNVLDVLANDLLLPDSTGVRLVTGLSATDHGGSVVIGPGGARVLYTPAPGFVGAEHFTYQTTDDTGGVSTDNATVAVLRTGADRDTNTVTITVNGVNDVPTLVGTAGGFNITDKQTVLPFTTVAIADLDEYGLQLQTVTLSLDNAAKGVLQNLGGFVMTSPGVYVLQGTPAAVTAAIQGLLFVPTENRITVPNTETTTFTISVDDGYVHSPVSDSTTTVNVTAVNDASTIAGTVGGFNITDKQTLQPFTSAVIADVDDLTIQPLTVKVIFDLAAKGTLSNLGGFTNSGGGIYTMRDTAANITASLQALVFVPTENRITVPTVETTTLTLSVDDGFVAGPVTNNATTVNVTAVNDPSTIAGTQGGFNITDKQTVQPFTNVVVADVDDLTVQPLTVVVKLDSFFKGTLQNLGVFTNSAPGRYTYTGTASNATLAINGMVFVPTENRIAVPNSEITTLSIIVNDGFVPSPLTNSATTINVTSVNDAPTIVGALSAQTITDKQTILAFSNVTIADVDNFGTQPLTVVVSLDNSAKGTLQNLGVFSNPTAGVYTATGAPAAITASLRALTFIPTENRVQVPNTETTTFTITANDGFVAAPVTNNLTTVIVTPVDESPAIVGTVANQRVYDHSSLHPFAGVTVTDVDSFGQQVLTITVTHDLPTHGFLTSLGGFVAAGGGVYTITNVTPAQATTALHGLIFVPTIVVSRLNPGAADTNRLTISANDGFVPAVVDTNTTVLATDSYAKKLTSTNGLNSTTFSSSLAATTNYVIAGMPNDNGAVNKSGAAYIYSRNAAGPETWTQVKKLVGAESPAATDLFGNSVSISGDTVVAGVPGTATGVAYIFDRNQGGNNNWGQSKKLVPAGGSSGDQFGTVAIYGDTIAVGSPRNGLIGAKSGAVYIYDRNQGGTTNWGQTQKLVPGDGVDNDAYGISVALYADTLAVGAQFNSPTTNGSFRTGTIYVYERNQGGSNNWGLVKKIVGSDSVNNDQFGHAVAIGADMIIAGAPSVTTNSLKSGAAYVFMRNQGGTNNWGQVKKLQTTDNLQGAQFGNSVAVDGENIAVGLLQTAAQGGGVYMFVRNSPGLTQWSLLEKFTPPTGDSYSVYGSSVAMGGSILAANARLDDGAGNWLGLTYIYRLKFDGFSQPNSIPDQFAVTGTPFTFAVPSGTFADSDSDTITYGATGLPGWLTFNPTNATFSGTPTVTGTNLITVTGSEIDGSSGSTQFHVIVRSLSELAFNFSTQSVGLDKVATFQLICPPGYTYRLQRAPALLNPISSSAWVDIATAATGTNQGSLTFYVTNSPIPAFYRVKSP